MEGTTMEVQALRSPAAIASTLRALREAQHKTQREMAQDLGVVLRQYERWEAGQQLPHLILVCYPDWLDVETADLLTEKSAAQ
jgi:transcriptional regulator with XRE-family HTH domain